MNDWNSAIAKCAEVCEKAKDTAALDMDEVKHEILALRRPESVDDGGFDAWWEKNWTDHWHEKEPFEKSLAQAAWNAARQHPAPPVSDEPCEHQYITTFGGDYCARCNVPSPSNEHPTPNASAEMERDAARWRYAVKHLRQWELSIKTYPDMGLTNMVDAAISAMMEGKS